MSEDCECPICGRNHRRLGTPPWAISREDVDRLSRVFNAGVRLDTRQDTEINEWLKAVARLSVSQNRPSNPYIHEAQAAKDKAK